MYNVLLQLVRKTVVHCDGQFLQCWTYRLCLNLYFSNQLSYLFFEEKGYKPPLYVWHRSCNHDYQGAQS